MALKWIGDAEPEEVRVEAHRIEITRYLKAQTDPGDPYQVILRARPDLATYQQHPTEPRCYVTRFNPQHEARGFWRLTVEYSTEIDDQKAENPLDRPAKVRKTSKPKPRVKYLDRNGNLILNTAGQLFDDPPPVEETNHAVFHVVKNIPTRFPPWLLQYEGAVNSDAVRLKGLTIPPNTLLCTKLEIGEDESENDVDFCTLEMEFEHDPDEWRTLIPNRGYYERIPVEIKAVDANGNETGGTDILSYKWVEIKIDGLSAKEPQFLDANGRWLEHPTPDQIILLPFELPPQMPFSRLPLR